MATTETRWCKIGDYIRIVDERNTTGADYDVLGINAQKQFMPTVANLEKVDLRNYKVVRKGMFVFSGMQTGRDECIRIALYTKEPPCTVSPAYTTFEITNTDELLPAYLFIYFMRNEMDRFGWFISDSSVRSNLDLPRFKNIAIPVPYIDGRPDIAKQKEIAIFWQGFRDLKEQNRKLAFSLLQLCRSYLEKLKKDCVTVKIGDYIETVDIRNENGYSYKVCGINNTKSFMPTAAKVDTVDLSKYKIVNKNTFAFSGMQTGRDECIRIALYQDDEPILVSPAYTTFNMKDNSGMVPEYLLLCFMRSEMDRYGWFISDSSVRANLDWPRFTAIEIPLPDFDTQLAIVELYHCAKEAMRIANEADELSRNICPALMQYIIHKNN